MDIKNILESGNVERYHTTPCIPNQKLSDHQWRVSMLLQKFYPLLSRRALLKALTHDCAEKVTGDAPSQIKFISPELKEIMEKLEKDIEKSWGINYQVEKHAEKAIKSCDILEGMIYCYDVVMSGSRPAIKVFQNWVDYYYNVSSKYAPIQMNDYVYQMQLDVRAQR